MKLDPTTDYIAQIMITTVIWMILIFGNLRFWFGFDIFEWVNSF